MCIGVLTYVVYVGSLWYFDEIGHQGFPIAAGVIIGIGAGMVFITRAISNWRTQRRKKRDSTSPRSSIYKPWVQSLEASFLS